MTVLTSIFPNGFTAPEPPPLQPPDIQLRIAIADAGLTPPDELIFDGKLHRFSTNGKPRDLSGWYVAHDGKLPAGAFGDWRSGMESTWRADIGRELNHVEMMQHSARMREVKLLRERELAAIRENAAHQAQELWDGAPLASDEHPYIKRKGISNPGWRLAADGRLMAPVMIDGEAVSLQYIDADGGKLFAKGGKVGGGWWSIGGQPADLMYLVEGVATAASVFEATGKPVGIAYSAGNLTAAATALRALYPSVEIVIVADRDESGTGEREAKRAAGIVSGVRVVVSPVGDANDYVQGGGDLGALLEPKSPAGDVNIQSLAEFLAEPLALDYVWQHILVKGWLYALTANPGSGKTAVSLYLAVMLAMGETLMEKKTRPCRVLFLCGENPQDVRIRTEVMMHEMGIDASKLDGRMYFTKRPFSIDDPVQLLRFINDVKEHGPFDLMLIDTGPAHSAADDENDNRAMHELAMAMRDLMGPIGMPCTIALMHPTKGATRDNLLPRGGSSFVGSVDGVLCLWRESKDHPAELFAHAQKFRGAHFEPMLFELQGCQHPTAVDNFGDGVMTVIAKPGCDMPECHTMSRLSQSVLDAAKAFENAINHSGYYRSSESLPFISADAWNEYERVTGEHASDSNRRKALQRMRDALKKHSIISEVRGGYVATEASLSGVFAGCFIGLKTYG